MKLLSRPVNSPTHTSAVACHLGGQWMSTDSASCLAAMSVKVFHKPASPQIVASPFSPIPNHTVCVCRTQVVRCVCVSHTSGQMCVHACHTHIWPRVCVYVTHKWTNVCVSRTYLPYVCVCVCVCVCVPYLSLPRRASAARRWYSCRRSLVDMAYTLPVLSGYIIATHRL